MVVPGVSELNRPVHVTGLVPQPRSVGTGNAAASRNVLPATPNDGTTVVALTVVAVLAGVFASQASPTPSSSGSAWSGLGTVGQLSETSGISSPSWSSSAWM